MSELIKSIGATIRKLRKAKNWSQEELGFQSNVHPSYIGVIERGEKSISIDSLEKILNGLNITFEDFFKIVGSTEIINTDFTILPYITQRLSRRDIKDQRIIMTLIEVLFPWKDDV
ncbi:MAG TPA: helix-turn-helix transcriptional regulator [Pseudobacteroides sp.]|uniref:helix-turn-helix domain-containing protein n=1 Tax=Pseudobacteroides sp. TaxID=1968840 RepID=UPI002F955E72